MSTMIGNQVDLDEKEEGPQEEVHRDGEDDQGEQGHDRHEDSVIINEL